MKVSFPVSLAALIVIPLGFQVVAAVAALPALEKATAHQCKTHDWPAAAHQVHMDWCAANGYDT